MSVRHRKHGSATGAPGSSPGGGAAAGTKFGTAGASSSVPTTSQAKPAATTPVNLDEAPSFVSSRTIWCGLVIFGISILVNLNTLEGNFVYDDPEAVVTNADVDSSKTSLLSIFSNDWWGVPMCHPKSHKCYRPITTLTLRMDFAAAGLDPQRYHMTNIIINAVVCVLFYILSVQLLRNVECEGWGAFASGVVFSVHPIHTESVANVVGRAELLSGLFYLLSLLTYMQACHKPAKKPTTTTTSIILVTPTAYSTTISPTATITTTTTTITPLGTLTTSVANTPQQHDTIPYMWPKVGLSIILAVIAMLSKEQGITVLGVCVIYDITVASKIDPINMLSTRWKKKTVLRIGVILLSTIVILGVRVWRNCGNMPDWDEEQNPVYHSPRALERFLMYSYLIAYHMRLLLFPHPLCYTYGGVSMPIIASTYDPRNLVTLAAFVIFCTLVGVCFGEKKTHTRTVTILALTLTVVPFLPASNIFFPVGFVIAERTLFIPSMGVAIVAGYLFGLLAKSNHKLFIILLGLTFLVCGGRTLTRNEDWNTAMALYRSANDVHPHNPVHLYNMGVQYEDEGKYELAIQHYRKSLEVDPKYVRSLGNLGKRLVAMGDKEAAEPLMREAAVTDGSSKTSCDYGALMLSQGKFAEAEKACSAPTTVECLSMLAVAQSNQGKDDLALRNFELSIKNAPDHPGILCNAAGFFFYKNPTRAKQLYEQAIRVAPGHELAKSQLQALLSGRKHNPDKPPSMIIDTGRRK